MKELIALAAVMFIVLATNCNLCVAEGGVFGASPQSKDSFESGIGIISLIKHFDNECAMAGGLYVGPTVVLEEGLHDIPAGTRVVPIAMNYISRFEGKYLGNSSRLTFRPAESSEGFEYLSNCHDPDVQVEVVIYLKDDLTWGEVRSESEIGVHQVMARM